MEKKPINKRRKLLLGIGASGAAVAWHKPLTNAIVLPAHAQMSVAPMPVAPMPVAPIPVCPMITLANVLTGPVSGTFTPPVCQVTFDVLSASSGVSLQITDISTSALPVGATVTVDSLGTATDTVGPRVVWRGPSVEAPFCIPVTPTDDVTFTITASCSVSGTGTFSQDFTLLSLL